MTINAYFTLSDDASGGATVKRFDVLASAGFTLPSAEKAGTVRVTIEGALDISLGASVPTTFERTIKVPETSADADYGSVSDLKYYFDLANPNGDPSNVIVLTDYDTTAYNVVIPPQKWSPVAISATLNNAFGTTAIYTVKLTFIRLP